MILPSKKRRSTFNLVPHALHLVQQVWLVGVLCEARGHLFRLLYVVGPEQGFCSDAIQVPGRAALSLPHYPIRMSSQALRNFYTNSSAHQLLTEEPLSLKMMPKPSLSDIGIKGVHLLFQKHSK